MALISGSQTITTANLTDLLDGGASALHSHAIADDSIVEAKFDVSNGPSNGQFLSAQSGEGGGLTWAAAGGALQSTELEFSRSASAGTGSQPLGGAGFTPTTLLIIALDKVSTFISWGWGDDAAGEAMVEADSGSFTQTSGRLVTVNDGSNGNSMVATLTSMDSGGCTIYWTKGGSGLDIHFIILFLR